MLIFSNMYTKNWKYYRKIKYYMNINCFLRFWSTSQPFSSCILRNFLLIIVQKVLDMVFLPLIHMDEMYSSCPGMIADRVLAHILFILTIFFLHLHGINACLHPFQYVWCSLFIFFCTRSKIWLNYSNLTQHLYYGAAIGNNVHHYCY